MPDARRIEREIRQVQSDKTANVYVQVVGDNLCRLKGMIAGPQGSPYEGGQFLVDIELPDDYPFKPPKMRFETPVYHPNISSQTGAICLDILKDEWSPVLTLKTVLISLQSLLCDPAPDNPQDAEVAKHYLSARADFEKTAREWTQIHAIGGSSVDQIGKTVGVDEVGLDQGSISRVCEMGFERGLVVKALRQFEGDEGQAVEAILSGTIS
ncbi:uncharacterized protein SPPG_01248 [Spizellomyces punctatus DAOM BR117]|uniref:Ubiquitin-conjugating enzyme E2 1 n=1 Tax=Spizellomyces punctatus (strain DAOM BR117) TaxID=645134 RepID=A0A0L0HRS6_SPIPD|nr:uncharacterized protein SPPG_01248 [Spizellomyces punctatus DAOM BR117]KND03792.1 hypothetical protein SPPG_01248 [Spizellomyces punctatus DAOM BR117]|eukprot:XP_016611831.1 hypothetical protein SPPG_01248 [Spizellomyces punctatus DAOM BR117]